MIVLLLAPAVLERGMVRCRRREVGIRGSRGHREDKGMGRIMRVRGIEVLGGRVGGIGCRKTLRANFHGLGIGGRGGGRARTDTRIEFRGDRTEFKNDMVLSLCRLEVALGWRCGTPVRKSLMCSY